MIKIAKKKEIQAECIVCNADLGPFFQSIYDGNDIAPPLNLLNITKIEIIRLSGEEREFILCDRCADFLEKKLKLAWADLTKIILEERKCKDSVNE